MLTVFIVFDKLIMVISTRSFRVLILRKIVKNCLAGAERMMHMLSERQLVILETIIRLYTNDGQPVGSKTLTEAPGIEASSATIRNEMSYLEEVGLIQKTHSSSGRIPSLRGYRFYVDNLLRPKKVAQDKLALINQALGQHVRQMDDIMHQSAQLLSELTSYTAIVLGPQAKQTRLTGFRLVSLNDNQVMAIIQTDTGAIENMVFRVPGGIEESDLEKVTGIFNEHLIGHSLLEVYRKLQNDIPMLIQKYASSAHQVLSSIENVLMKSQEDRYHISGKTNLLDFTENMETQQVKSLYNILENSGDLSTLIQQMNQDIDIKIGQEMNHDLFNQFSLVTASYHVKGHGNGLIAVLGPTSMSYDKTLGVIEVFRNELAETLLRFYLE